MPKPPQPHAELLDIFRRKDRPDALLEHRNIFLTMLLGRLYTPLYSKLAVSPSINQDAFEFGKKEYVSRVANTGFEIVHDSMASFAGRLKTRTARELVDHIASLTQQFVEFEIGHRWTAQNAWLTDFGLPHYSLFDASDEAEPVFSSEGYLPNTLYAQIGERIETCPPAKRTPAFLGTVAYEGVKSSTSVQLPAEERFLKTNFEALQQRSAA